jgi:hypothetical protein
MVGDWKEFKGETTERLVSPAREFRRWLLSHAEDGIE